MRAVASQRRLPMRSCTLRRLLEVAHPVGTVAAAGKHVQHAVEDREPDLDRVRLPGYAPDRGQVAVIFLIEARNPGARTHLSYLQTRMFPDSGAAVRRQIGVADADHSRGEGRGLDAAPRAAVGQGGAMKLHAQAQKLRRPATYAGIALAILTLVTSCRHNPPSIPGIYQSPGQHAGRRCGRSRAEPAVRMAVHDAADRDGGQPRRRGIAEADGALRLPLPVPLRGREHRLRLGDVERQRRTSRSSTSRTPSTTASSRCSPTT